MATRKRKPGAKKKSTFVPMLRDGLPEAIKSIRERKGLSQAEAAARSGVKSYHWSQYETRVKRLSIAELPIITKGLGVTRTDLWHEKYEMERPNYEGPQPDEIGDETPRYGMPRVIAVLQSLLAMDSEKLPAKWQKTFNDRRNHLISALSNDLRESDDLKEFYARLLKTGDDAED